MTSNERERETELAWREHTRRVMRRATRLTPELRNRMAEAQNWRCCYCGCRMEGSGHEPNAPSFEHITPTVLGGTDDDDNIAIACRDCNERRGGAYSE